MSHFCFYELIVPLMDAHSCIELSFLILYIQSDILINSGKSLEYKLSAEFIIMIPNNYQFDLYFFIELE